MRWQEDISLDHSDGESQTVITATASIVSAYLANAHTVVTPEAIPALIRDVMSTITEYAPARTPVGARTTATLSDARISATLFPDHIVCLEDGKKLKMLKRHLHLAHRMTPEQYREKWGLPADYPMTAPSHAERRSTIALETGLGHGRTTEEPGPLLEEKLAGPPRPPEPPAQEADAGNPAPDEKGSPKQPRRSAVERVRARQARSRARSAEAYKAAKKAGKRGGTRKAPPEK
ncbi:hypothetical protein DY926_13280 [Komagataeibacter melaceti]|uniref:MucR family transcriptional regulator n=1 Tax=Komagataeibacter melaceti TaxID=2766577 RepID=A0A371YXV7_9PROT|nr:hypothetical protein DY926_13280 [Komagataeibacter melaceti]